MSQIMSQVLGQQMRLEQRLTPQLIQSMDILHLSSQALEQRIAEELERNVALELVEREKSDPRDEEGNGNGNREPTDGAGADSFTRLERFSRENQLDISDDRYVPRRPRVAAGERDAKMDAMANTASRTEGLDEHLMRQWVLLDIDDETRKAGEAIIYHLDDDGYLRTPLAEIADSTNPPISVDRLEAALKLVQTLDPVGIAARSFEECLLLQLDALPGDNAIERELIKHHLDDVAKNRYPVIAKKTGYSIGEISAAVDVIRRSLVLHPGYLVVDRRVPRVYPDVVVEQAPNGKSLIVRLTRGNMPDLRIKTDYAEMLKDRKNGKDVRDFVRKQVEDANSLIEAVRFRKTRLAEVAEAIVMHQSEFFDIGPAGLKVFRMSDLAEELGCDPSTISRTVAEKYMDTPHGIYPLRYFFTGGTESNDGSGKSWDSIKQRVAEIIKHEDPKNPLSDDQVAEKLQGEGIDIKRRTVAKYRSQLDIPPARQRRKF